MIRFRILFGLLFFGLLSFNAQAQEEAGEADVATESPVVESGRKERKEKKGKEGEDDFGQPKRVTKLQEKERTWSDLHKARKKQKNALKGRKNVRSRSQYGPLSSENARKEKARKDQKEKKDYSASRKKKKKSKPSSSDE